MKWIKWSESFPTEGAGIQEIWVTDGKEIWPSMRGSVVSFNRSGTMTHWMERIVPALPKEEKHFCRNDQDNFACYQSYPPENKLWIRAFEKGKMRMDFPVKFCPFCGFTLEEK